MSGMDVLGSTQQKASHAHPYTSSVASSASSSSSIFSLDGVSCQSSVSSCSVNAVDIVWENEVSSGDCQATGRGLAHASESNSRCLGYCRCRGSIRGSVSRVADPPVPPELRKHPRRTSNHVSQSNGVSSACPRPPPSLVRQCERKVNFVDNLVDSASQIVESIWPLSAVALRSNSPVGCKGVLPLRTFIQETLRRSRTSYSTLQVALYYLIKIKPHLPKRDFTMEQSPDKPMSRAMQCGRRMFLAALILASKYLQDRNYSARAWSKISGLTPLEINQIELMFLDAVGWRLHISQAIFQRWTDIVLRYTPSPGCQSPSGDGHCWSSIIPKLTARLDTIDLEPIWAHAGFESVPVADSSPPLSPKTFLSSSSSPSSSSSSSSSSSAPSLKGEQTSTCQRGLTPTLEPTRNAEYSNPPLPALPKLSLLPTPQMTPESSAASTPAVGAGGIYSLRPSICTALSQAQRLCLARSTLDQRPRNFTCHKPTVLDAMVCRSSLARSASSTSSTSLASSPESMVSDVSSMSFRSSRSSSISSSSSSAPATCAPIQPSGRKAVKATCRGATNLLKECRKNLVIASPIDEVSFFDVCNSPDTYTGPTGSTTDLNNYSVNAAIDLTTSTREAAQGLCELAGAIPRSKPFSDLNSEPRRCRKRGRTTSEESILQSNVRHLMTLGAMKDDEVVLPDQNLSNSFLLPEPQSGLSSSGNRLGSINLPVLPTSMSSIKRACCESEPYGSRRRC